VCQSSTTVASRTNQIESIKIKGGVKCEVAQNMCALIVDQILDATDKQTSP
jgi:hypothetical protein